MARLRGPGDFFGARQHGLPGLKVADLGCDTQLLQEARQAAEQLAEWGIIPHRWGKSFTDKHVFTHITWEMTVFTITVQGAGPPEWVWCPDEEREKYPMPTAFGKLEKE